MEFFWVFFSKNKGGTGGRQGGTQRTIRRLNAGCPPRPPQNAYM